MITKYYFTAYNKLPKIIRNKLNVQQIDTWEAATPSPKLMYWAKIIFDLKRTSENAFVELTHDGRPSIPF